MSLGLCFQCGHTKPEALGACPECMADTAGDPDLHLAFSSLYLSRATIGAFGDVIRAIGTACPDPLLRFWTFIRYASVNHPDLLGVDLPAEKAAECDAILEKANPPAVTISAAERKKFQRDEEPAE